MITATLTRPDLLTADDRDPLADWTDADFEAHGHRLDAETEARYAARLAALPVEADTQELTDEQIEELLADYELLRSGVVFEDEAY